MPTGAKSIFEVIPNDGGIFMDNLAICSADRLLSTKYRGLESDGALNEPAVAATLFCHDLLNLSLLVESIVCHESIYVNVEYVDRWNSDIETTALHPLNDIVVPVCWLGKEREE